ncbi:MAG: ECF transporter S component [Lachnospiraceae bacterium]|nr:ECF transporter S component [Lachnospiraceae bacterium]
MNNKTKAIVGVGLLTAIVVILQALAVSIRFGVFNITLVLVPVIVGVALFGPWAGMWLGAVFGLVVLFTDAGVFLAINAPGTIVTCMLKGMLAGFLAGLAYNALEQKSKLLAVIVAGIVAPVVNTGIFLIGCRLFFYSTIREWAEGAGFANAGAYMIFGLAGINFLVELAINLVLSTVIVRIIGFGLKSLNTQN